MKFLFLLACVLSLGGPAFSKDEAPASERMRVRMWRVPPDFFPKAKVKLLSEESAWSEQWDVREFLREYGLKFAPEEKAIYKLSGHTMVVQGRPETLRLVERMGFGHEYGESLVANVKLEASMVEFSAARIPALHADISVEAMRKAAGDSWQVLNRAGVVGESGQRVMTTVRTDSRGEKQIAPTPAKDQPELSGDSDSLPEGALGTVLEVEPTTDSDGRIVDVNLIYHYRMLEPEIWDWQATLTTRVRAGIPTLAQINSAPPLSDGTPSTKVRALIIRADVFYSRTIFLRHLKQSDMQAAKRPFAH